MKFIKGHGTSNDFILIIDYCDGKSIDYDLTADSIAGLCNRRSGIGADGLIRVVRAKTLLDSGVLDNLPTGVRESEWFMDYYNSDGSVAQMCGNGARVFAHYLYSAGYETEKSFSIGTRSGRKEVTINEASNNYHATVQVGIGRVISMGSSSTIVYAHNQRYSIPGYIVDVGNPHLACVIANHDIALEEWDFRSPKLSSVDFPDGGNLELVYPHKSSNGHLSCIMRVYERGSGETLSCGTGAVAAARSVASHYGVDSNDCEVTVSLPGGTLIIEFRDSCSFLTGPSQLVASGVIFDDHFESSAYLIPHDDSFNDQQLFNITTV